MSPSPTDSVRRSSFRSADDGEITHFIRQMYADFTPWLPAGGDAVSFAALSVDVPAIGMDRVRTTMGYTGRAEHGFTDYVFYVVREGGMATGSSVGETDSTVGSVACNPIGVPVEVAAHGFETTTVRLSADLVSRVAEETSGVPASGLALLGLTPVSPAMARYWRSLTALVSGALMDPDSPLASPLMAEELARTVAVAALQVFPNTTMTLAPARGPGQAAPATVRRAAAYIEAHAEEPLTLTDIAAAAGTSPRALQYGFRRHLGTTPLEHARRVRLELARRDLQQADPTRGDTVTAVAHRWGFTNAGRFAAAYREAFGVSPATTLRG